ncbi:hypothetical protein Ctob_016507 [Chrysochromulina tobinii]|uniref:Uncharacterized protein n=1 Tax=Chrysochromulina tobinii TaxID=1460289 RepID=A0A0M0KCJ7_9EUKA|nr:hypothetical protein Ctob_016507 [Chrysochromulina tobinii]|eukprot:KOO36138.1 hypothetical protein Ctob_016507 [Chrysochromulina sp. CCMP291]
MHSAPHPSPALSSPPAVTPEPYRAARMMGDSSRTPQPSWAPGRSWAASPQLPFWLTLYPSP